MLLPFLIMIIHFQENHNGTSTLEILEEKKDKTNQTRKTFKDIRNDLFFISFLVLIYSYFVWATVYFIQDSGE